LGKQLELGNITADEMLPKLAAELSKVGGAAGATGLQADLNRLNNAYTELQLAFANTGGISTASSAIQGMTSFVVAGQIAVEQLAGAWRQYQADFARGAAVGGGLLSAERGRLIREAQGQRDANAMFSPQGRITGRLRVIANSIGVDGQDVLSGLVNAPPSPRDVGRANGAWFRDFAASDWRRRWSSRRRRRLWRRWWQWRWGSWCRCSGRKTVRRRNRRAKF
jgi:hypothetical protein